MELAPALHSYLGAALRPFRFVVTMFKFYAPARFDYAGCINTKLYSSAPHKALDRSFTPSFSGTLWTSLFLVSKDWGLDIVSAVSGARVSSRGLEIGADE